MSFDLNAITGVGLGLRRDFFYDVLAMPEIEVDFFEIAPENWLNLGGKIGRDLRKLTERHPFVCHGLSLDLGGIAPLNEDYLYQLKTFFHQHEIRYYTEHLSYCGDTGQLYDLMPIPFTEEAVYYVANRIKRVQDILDRTIGIENISFYAMPSSEMTEQEFVNAVVSEAECGLLFDVNNTYVNSINHQYDAKQYMQSMPTDAIMYLHMAGHFDEAEDLKVDTHGEDVKQEVWDLLDQTYDFHGLKPTLLERDFNIPPLPDLMVEVEQIRQAQQRYLEQFKVKNYG